MPIKMVCLEDGITSCAFGRMAAYVAQLNPDTESCYVSTNRFKSVANVLKGTFALRRADVGIRLPVIES